MADFQLLVVSPVGWDIGFLSKWKPYNLVFQFVESFPSDGLSAWRIDASPQREFVNVTADCRSYTGGFAQHALNRIFSQALLRLTPKLVVVIGAFGCTIDLVRIASLLNIPVVLLLNDYPVEDLERVGVDTKMWLESSLAACSYIVSTLPEYHRAWSESYLDQNLVETNVLNDIVACLLDQSPTKNLYDYSLYEFCQRDHPLLMRMQQGDTRHFETCGRVLDLACGVGIFLDCLRQAGIKAEGVERDNRIVKYAKGMGLSVTAADALEFLSQSRTNYDGIYCSHFIEHLPVDAVQRVLQLAAARLDQDGILVLVFPDPESIRSQLLGFWRDPEHVRFYHPDLITLMATSVGFELEWSSYNEQPHTVIPFAAEPPPIEANAIVPALSFAADTLKLSIGERLLRIIGLVTEKRFRALEVQLVGWGGELSRYVQQRAEVDRLLEERTNTLWSLNQTWSWNDNVTLRLRKKTRCK